MVCYECGNENASMNLICAYCGFPFARDHGAVRCECEAVTWALLGLALVVPVVGVVAGFAAMRRPELAHRVESRRWLIAALISSLAYIALLMRYLLS